MTTATSITVRVPLAIRHQPGRKTVVTPMTDGVAPVTTRADPALVKALARAFRYQRMLDNGVYGSVTDMAAAEKIDRGYLGRLLQLTLLAPDIVEEMLNGGLPLSLHLMRVEVPSEWTKQRIVVAKLFAPARDG
ncbi:MAG: hypothetical protein K5Q68_18535 [Roseococcus sp.]|jgi:hypothetical protein|uniref:Bacteriophage-related protein n=1 Tax=Sediminicoccus rosea TaxID=1225128 RepID=A0ABZ0PDG5_9PROT|nr:hypothetical protein [Sediminicoccus rosea]MBX9751592.1 hypothetical protein [Roseococcus sp.]WPB83675.1 hypothetical protein R9Z33_16360 [Sediminicoccus rosea]